MLLNETKKYRTNQGETWDTISLDFYNTPFKIAELISANPNYADVVVFEKSVEINIPILETEKSNTLAPWKRGA